MYLIQVVLGSGATAIVGKDPVVQHPTSFQTLVIQNNGTAVVRVGDATVSATKGIALAAGSTTTQPALVLSPTGGYSETLSSWYLFGTAAQVIDVMVIP